MFNKKKRVNVIKLEGVIGSSGKKMISLTNYKKLIDKAFNDKKAKAVAVVINSPGGSPAQSEIIANYIIAKSKETKKEVVTFAEDLAASGGYWLALAGEMFFALSNTSIVGSLGVVYASFGLDEFIAKHSITRRVYTAGKSKVSMDTFQKEKEEDVARLKTMLADVHEHFKDWVLVRRGNKITIPHEELFTGEFWIASRALQKGLIDGICNLEDKLKELYGQKICIKYLEKQSWGILNLFRQKTSLMGENIGSEVINDLKSEFFWNRFGM